MLLTRVLDLNQSYRHLAGPWTQEELCLALRGGRPLRQATPERPDPAPERPIALLASAIPSAATLSVAIHLLRALPGGAQPKLAGELLLTAEKNATDALTGVTGHSSATARLTATPPTIGCPLSTTRRHHCSNPLAWTKSHRRSFGRPRRRCDGYQPRSPASARILRRPPRPLRTRSADFSSCACSPAPTGSRPG